MVTAVIRMAISTLCGHLLLLTSSPNHPRFFWCKALFLLGGTIPVSLNGGLGGTVNQNAPTSLAQWMGMYDWTLSPQNLYLEQRAPGQKRIEEYLSQRQSVLIPLISISGSALFPSFSRSVSQLFLWLYELPLNPFVFSLIWSELYHIALLLRNLIDGLFLGSA